METIIAITPSHCLDPQIAIAASKTGELESSIWGGGR